MFSVVTTLAKISPAKFSSLTCAPVARIPVVRADRTHITVWNSGGRRQWSGRANSWSKREDRSSFFSSEESISGWLLIAPVVFGLALSTSSAAADDSKPAPPSDTPTQASSPAAAEKATDDEASVDDDEPVELTAKYLIIGGGTAAFSALKAILENDTNPAAKIVMVVADEHQPYLRPPLSKELWKASNDPIEKRLRFTNFEGKEQSVFFEELEFWAKLEASGRLEVVRVNKQDNMLLSPDAHTLRLYDATVVRFEKCLLATGGEPNARIPGLTQLGKHVSTFRTVGDYQRLRGLVRDSSNTKHVVIVGGGFLGSELAWALTRFPNLKLTHVVSSPTGIMSTVLPQYLSQQQTAELQRAGVDVRTGRIVTRIDSPDGPANAHETPNAASAPPPASTKATVHLDNGQKLDADHVIVAAGLIPNTRVAQLAGLEIDDDNRGIVVNGELQARSDVYAAGDVASYYDYFLGRRRVEHHDHAVESGATAGKNMTGAKQMYMHMPMFWGDLGPRGYEAVGVCDSSLPTVGVWLSADGKPTDDPSKFNKGAVYYLSPESKQVVGVLLWGVFGKVDQARKLIRSTRRFDDLDRLKWAVPLDDVDLTSH